MVNTPVLKDPVCGMTVTSHSFHHLEHLGQTHYFCGVQCKARFASHTLRYTNPDALHTTLATENVSLRLFKGHTRWVLLLSVAAVLAAFGRWLV